MARKIIFGAYDTDVNWGLTLTGYTLSAPSYKSSFVSVPGRDGDLDLSTALTDGEPRYNNRDLTATFELSTGTRATRETTFSTIVNALDGRRVNITLPDDSTHYITGRLRVAIQYNDLAHGALTITGNCDPWRYASTAKTATLECSSIYGTSPSYQQTVPEGVVERAQLGMIGGKTVVMNQLAVSPTRASEILSGMTYTNNNNGTFTINGTANATDFYTICVNTNVPVANHKYLICGCPTTGTGRYWLGFGGNNADDDGNGAIITNTSRPNLSVIFKYVSGASFNNVIFKPQIFDLTKMFGAGNEPSTVAQFKAIFPDDYYAYNAGNLLSARVDNVVTKKADTTTLATFPIPSQIRALTGYGWSAGTAYNEVNFETKKYIQRVGAVDLGSLTWSYVSASHIFNVSITNKKAGSNFISAYNCSSANFSWASVDALPDQTIYGISTNSYIYVKDTTHSSASDFKTAMSGVILYYELATPIETDISAYITDNYIQVEAGGTITFEQVDDTMLLVPNTTEYFIGGTVTLSNAGRRLLVPTVVISGTGASVQLTFGSSTWTLSAGTYKLPDLILQQGNNSLTYKGTGTAVLTWREAIL